MTKSRPVHIRHPWAIGGGGGVKDLIHFSPWIILLGRFVVTSIIHYRMTAIVVAAFYAWYTNILPLAIVVACLGLSGFITYLYVREFRHHRNPTFTRLTVGIWRVWRFKNKWPAAAAAAGLRKIPRVSKVHSNANGVNAKAHVGKAYHTASDLMDNTDEIAAVMGCSECTVEQVTPGVGVLHLVWGDPTQRLLSLSDVPQTPDNRSVVFALDADRQPVSLSLETSVLAVGVSRSGKSNTIWSILGGLLKKGIPFRIRVIDPSGGVELGRLEHSPMTRSYTDSPLRVDEAIGYAVFSMNKRMRDMDARGDRWHTPTVDEPFEILLIDELLKVKNREVDGPLGEILSNGAKAGYFVVALSQLSQIDALGRIRDLFPQRICLATKSSEMTDAVLGHGATKEGARCHRITKLTKGVGYYHSDEQRQYIRFRTPLITDPDADIIANGEVPRTLTAMSLRVKSKVNRTSMPLLNRKTGLYKVYSEYGEYLYAGIAVNPSTRLAEHAADKVWWVEVDQSKTQIIWYKNRREAKRAETYTIQNDRPKYNVAEVRVTASAS